MDFALDARSGIGASELAVAANEGLVEAEEVLDWIPAAWFEMQQRHEFVSAWHRTNYEAARLLSSVQGSLRRGSMSDVGETLESLGALGEFSGSGTISAAAAIYLASRSGTRPISGLLQGAFQHGADTDTVAAMTGALLGAIHGDDWLGQLRSVQDHDYIGRLAESLTRPDPRYRPSPPVPSRVVLQELDSDRREGNFADGRRYAVNRRELIAEHPWVERIHLEFADGQTAFIDKVRKSPRAEVAAQIERPAALEESLVESSSAPRSNAAAGHVTLPVADFDAVVAFYRRIVPDDLAVEGDAVFVAPWLQFAKSAAEASLWTADAKIELLVGDLSEAARATGAAVSRDDRSKRLVLSDPDGRLDKVRQRT